jgi:hypothetical protein
VIELTSVGEDYALRQADTSLVARVALGQDGDWPEQYINLARRLMNAEGDGSKLTDDERVITLEL